MENVNKNEKFKFIDGYNNKYLISNYGRVFNLRTFKFLAINTNSSGYPRVELYKGKKNGIRIRNLKFIHLLVVQYFGDCNGYTFCDFYDNVGILQVDHIDKNKLHCHSSNLEIVSNKENIRRKLLPEKEREKLGKEKLNIYLNLGDIF